MTSTRLSRPFSITMIRAMRAYGEPGVTYSFTRLLDDVVRPRQQRRRDGEAERSCSLQVDHQLELAGLLHRKLARPGAFQDLVDVARRTPDQDVEVGPIAHEAPRAYPGPPAAHQGNALLRGEVHDAWTIDVHEPR